MEATLNAQIVFNWRTRFGNGIYVRSLCTGKDSRVNRTLQCVATLFATLLLAAGMSTLAASDALATTVGSVPNADANQNSAQARQVALSTAVQRHAIVHPNATGRHICYAAHVTDVGWQQPVCDGALAGTTGQGLRIEALDIVVTGVGGVCAAAHVENIGWQAVTCAGDNLNVIVGTTGRGLRMEALDINGNSGTVCAVAHVENIGWQSPVCAAAPAYAMVGTTGRGVGMEAVELTV
jgi:uncharacterized protein YjdB